ncbi:MAG TPA: nickel-dependent hydrogenase large subunit [Thermoanaerobaculia bacterium]
MERQPPLHQRHPRPYARHLRGPAPAEPVAGAEHPLEVLRTIHSFDPCMACAVHTFDPSGRNIAKVKVL